MKRFLLFAILIFFPAIAVSSENGRNCYPIEAEDLMRNDAPRFEKFPSMPENLKHTAKVNLKSHPMARRYRTVLLKGAAEGANFAGHYSVVGWGCGTSCVQFAVVDLESGQVIFPDDFSVISGVNLEADEFEAEAGGHFWGLRYRLDSRLFIVLGTLDEDETREGAFYYLLEKEKLKRIFSVNVLKNDCKDRKRK